MSGSYEKEDILKEYDSGLMRRILSYLRPYMLHFLLSIAALLIATGAELITPIIIQRATDNNILPYHRGLKIAALSPEQRESVAPINPDYIIEGIFFFPSSRLSNLSTVEKAKMRRDGILFADNYIMIENYSLDAEITSIVDSYPELMLKGNRTAAITDSDLHGLPGDEIKVIRRSHYTGLNRLVVILVGALVAVFIFTFLQVYLGAFVGQMTMKDMRSQLYGHTLGLSLKFLDKNPVGGLVSRITNDVETINQMFTDVLNAVLKDLSMMAGVMIALFILNPRLGLVAVLSLPPVFFITVIFRGRARDVFRKVRLTISRLNTFLSEHISGMRIVQLFVQEKRTRQEFRKRNDDAFDANLTETRLFALFRPLADWLSTVSIAVIIYFGAGFLMKDLVSLGVLIAFLNLIRMFYQPVLDLSEKYNILQSAMAGAERVFSLLDSDDELTDPAHPISIGRAEGRIEFDRVNFAYKEAEPVLRDLSFTINPGETVAIVGYTGAGKTTITSVLTRLWDIQSGSIRVDGTDIRDIPRDVLRGRVQIVLQDVFLFSGTIIDNIRLSGNISEKEIRKAVELAQADSFIDRNPEGLYAMLNERGANLSTGQRQLLSFARVMAHNPDILVLDEATGNIDTETEKLIQEALAVLLHGRTSLVIAHRLSTIQNADRILVLHNGGLFEEGNHEQLMKKRGMYFNLYQMQFLKKVY